MSRTATPPIESTQAQARHSSPSGSESLTAPLRSLLEQINEFISSLPEGQYAAAPPAHLAGTIGAHIRHCLDHVAVLAAAQPNATLDYDHRDRGTPVEQDPQAARSTITKLVQQLETLDRMEIDAALHATLAMSPHHRPHNYATTLGREVAFVLSHTVHHQALLAAAARAAGHDVPHDFGVAPATLAHRVSN